MTSIWDYLDMFALGFRISDGYIRSQAHPTEPLVIYNYTNKTQYEQVWDEVTTRCRGLIVNYQTHDVVARPFEKFFNWGQVDRGMLPSGPIRVQDKMDGSLGILYVEPEANRLAIATRGSFTSEQALHATEVLRTRYEDFRPVEGFTYLFEIVYPENRIVVDYDGMDDLVLLDILETASGRSCLEKLQDSWPGPVVKEFNFDSLVDVLNTPPRAGKEGFVVTFKDGTRVKVKQDEYVRLHRLLTGVSNKTIWEILANGGDLDEILDRVPDEYYHWVRNTAGGLVKEFNRIYDEAAQAYSSIFSKIREGLDGREYRKEFAKSAVQHEYRGILFAMLDGKSVEEQIWKMIKPAYAKPFWNQSEDVA